MNNKKAESTPSSSVSFPYTRCDNMLSSAAKSMEHGSSIVRFKPVRSEIFMKEFECLFNLSPFKVEDKYAESDTGFIDESTLDVLNTSILEDNTDTNDDFPEISLLKDTPEKCPVKTKEDTLPKFKNNSVLKTSTETFSAVRTNETSSNANFLINTQRKDSVVKKNLFSDQNTSSNNSLSFNSQLFGKPPSLNLITPRRPVTKSTETPKQNIQASIHKNHYTPRFGQNIFRPKPGSAKKPNDILREKDMNVLSATANKQKTNEPIPEEELETIEIDAKKEPVKQNVQVSVPAPALPKNNLPYSVLNIHGIEYIVINKLGEGGSGQVYRCLEQNTLQDRAVKIVNLAVDALTRTNYINEVKMLRDLQSTDRVIKMFDYEKVDQTLFVVMEKGDVDFSTFLRNITIEPQIQTHVIICYWIEMLKCVNEIHQNGIIHSDLKPSNFLIVTGRLKLIDFGISSRLSSEMTSVIKNEQVGTFNYISPEALLDSRENSSEGRPRIRISYKSDVWSLGCILYQMVYRKTPFQSITNWMLKVATIVDRNHKIEYPSVAGVPPYLIEMIRRCLVYEMKSRPTVQDLLTMYFSGQYY